MLGKLLKHEMIYLVKTFSPIYIAFLGLSVLMRVFTLMNGDFDMEENALYFTLIVFAGIVGAAFGVLSAVMALMTMVDNIRRFKNNMFTDEGYLTNTLPVTATEHIAAKLLAGIINYLVSVVVLVLGLFIASKSTSDAIGWIWKEMISDDISIGYKLSTLLLGLMIFLTIQLLGYLIAALNNMVNSFKGFLSFFLGFAAVMFFIIMSSRITAFALAGELSALSTILVVCAFLFACCVGMYLLIVNIIKHHLNLQ